MKISITKEIDLTTRQLQFLDKLYNDGFIEFRDGEYYDITELNNIVSDSWPETKILARNPYPYDAYSGLLELNIVKYAEDSWHTTLVFTKEGLEIYDSIKLNSNKDFNKIIKL